MFERLPRWPRILADKKGIIPVRGSKQGRSVREDKGAVGRLVWREETRGEGGGGLVAAAGQSCRQARAWSAVCRGPACLLYTLEVLPVALL